MLRHTGVCRKNPVIMKQGGGKYTHQLKHHLVKVAPHYKAWEPIPPLYEPRRLWHASRRIDPATGLPRHDPHRDGVGTVAASAAASSAVPSPVGPLAPTAYSRADAGAGQGTFWVPDQEWLRVPVPAEYKDAYWGREREARRHQGKDLDQDVIDKVFTRDQRYTVDFNDFGLRPRRVVSAEDAVRNLRRSRQ